MLGAIVPLLASLVGAVTPKFLAKKNPRPKPRVKFWDVPDYQNANSSDSTAAATSA